MRNLSCIIILCCFCFSGIAQSKQQPVLRGTWITNVASDAMRSQENVEKAVVNCKKNGLTDIFVVVWNGGVTMYPSEVVNTYIGIKQSAVYKNFDPLKAFVTEGHKAGLRVHAWFEFGAAYAYKDSTANGWLEKYPTWAGKNNKGELLKKNGFFWWNAMNPEVQGFLQKLMLEVVTNYDVDGVQGDDRLPAMPGEGGYDAYSVDMYKKEFAGKQPPQNSKDSVFIQWKANKISAFGKQLYQAVKKQRSNCLVTWAPSIYPWSKEQYLQDWPAWLNGGYADLIIPQLYRYNIGAYEKILKELSTQVPDKLKHKVFPGILTSLGDGYRVDAQLLKQMMDLNRQYGYNGEVFFYYESVNSFKEPLYK
jgi:uncharacterized lipoprotein YddW (UPF0748 family)